MMENGAYNVEWPDAHMFPEEAVQAHMDLRGKIMLPIHNSTFPLGFHPWYEPLERISTAAAKQGIQVTTPTVGEIFTIEQEPPDTQWWTTIK